MTANHHHAAGEPYHYKHGWIPIDGAPTSGVRTADIHAARAHVTAAMERGNLPEHMRQPMLQALSHQERYPGLVEHLETISLNQKGKTWDAAYGYRKLEVKASLFDRGGEFERGRLTQRAAEIAAGKRIPWFARVKAVEDGRASLADAAIAHEMGHVAEDVIGKKAELEAFTAMAHTAGLPEIKPVMQHFNDGGPPEIDNEATLKKWFKNEKVRVYLSRGLSQYSNSNYGEAAAEMWMVYSLDGPDAPAWVRAYGDSAVAAMTRKNSKRAAAPTGDGGMAAALREKMLGLS